MKFLIIGSGGREHAIAYKLLQSDSVSKVYCAPGNAGIALDVECVALGVEQHEEIADFAKISNIDCVIIGPEVPLCAGLTDVLNSRGIKVFGPDKIASQLEGSKIFAKQFMDKYNMPTAKWKSFSEEQPCIDFVNAAFDSGVVGLVVKADGLAAGKGVVVALNRQKAIVAVQSCFAGAFGSASLPVLIEECLLGEEMSVLALTDGKNIIPLVSAQDYKRLETGDLGPNTGGMGTSSPAPNITPELEKVIQETVLTPFLKGIQAENFNYHGIIFIGLMITKEGPQVLEFNVRFGDPETQVILSRIKSDLGELFLATIENRLGELELKWDERAAVCVVMASGGYPENYEKGHAITGLQNAAMLENVKVFHAGTSLQNGNIVNTGGRVLGVTALDQDIKLAATRAYEAVKKISWKDCIYRTDIGSR